MLVGVPAFALLVLFIWILVPGLPTVEEVFGRPDLIFMGITGLFTLGVIVFSVATIRTTTPSRTVGILLAIFALGWVLTFGGIAIIDGEFPPPCGGSLTGGS